jgi:hypothetical protein
MATKKGQSPAVSKWRHLEGLDAGVDPLVPGALRRLVEALVAVLALVPELLPAARATFFVLRLDLPPKNKEMSKSSENNF